MHTYPDGKTEADNALWISMEGGYGQFIDPMVEMFEIQSDVLGVPRGEIFLHDPTDAQRVEMLRRAWKLMEIVLCHECAHDLCDKFPAFKNRIDPHHSHSHKTSYVESHPDHYGWDYDHRESDGE